ncbi:phosphoribosylformylglycinamidine synthase subunit PurQ [Azorhizobium doebereinerae]|uniref:phosphoribosylformylglycinamidine synthase subunit PurQ n=1 Tax=Azorhizobium doebereinerae TaxID=281091 RepID=UPI000426285E|nr:phosphoribosylformylglycinamidine synthase subunit PurQ [Azorhizobium doebereinerae]
MKAAVLLFPGSNREGDAARALRLVTGKEPAVVWHAETELPQGTDLVVLPGGFSYGDYLRCGAIAARANIMTAVRAHAAKGGMVLGICNGFQILCEAGLLPGVLVRNAKLRFVCREVFLRVERADTAFTKAYRKGDLLRIPVAHGEGNYTADPATIQMLEAEGRVAFRYARVDGQIDEADGPNGAIHGIAGIYSDKLNVLGMMPHPENHVDPVVGPVDGRGLFESIAGALKAA